MKPRAFKHGHASQNGESSEYTSWRAMCQRGTNPNRDHADRYFKRGIRVCKEWLGRGGFARFLAHIGRKPAPSYQVERIDNERGYLPGNVRWATRQEQQRNVTPRLTVTAFGETLTLKQWGEKYSIKPDTLRQRLSAGWDVEKAVSQKTRKYNRGPR